MKQKVFIFFLVFTLFSLVGKAQVQVGNSHNDYGKCIPISPRRCTNYTQVIYLASEIQTSGTITQLKWDYGGSSMTHSNVWTIYMGHTSKTSFTSTTDWIPVSNMTQVWSGSFSDPGGPTWLVFDITDWAYNGTDNIVVAVHENETLADSYDDTFYATSVSANRGIYYYGPDDCSLDPDPANPPTATGLQSFVANIIFDGITLSTPAPTNLTENNIILNAADLGWTETGTATKWDIEWKEAIDFTPGTGHATGTTTATSNPYTLSNLSANATYYWYVRSDYRVEAGTGISDWSGPGIFTTADGKAVNPSPAVGVGGVSITATTLDWDDVPGASGYHINIGTSAGNWNVVSNAAVTGGTNSSYTYSNNWGYGTDYYWLVVTDYNTNQQVAGSTWNFFTCQIVQPPYFEDFDNVVATDIPSCMQVENINNDGLQWETTTEDYYSTPNAVKIGASAVSTMNDYLFTQGVYVDASADYEISFNYKAENASYPEKLSLDYGPDALSTSMSGTPIFDNSNITNTEWKNEKVTVTLSQGNHFFGFRGYSNAGSRGVYLDDIRIVKVASSSSWSGSTDTEWDNPNNWSDGVPTSATNVTISSGASHYPTLTHSVECNNLVVNSGATLTISPGKNLTVNGDLTNNAASGNFVLESDNSGNGSLIVVGTITGTVTVERYIPAYVGTADGWHEIGCPVTSYSVSGTDWDPTVTGSNNDLYYWDESTNLWMNYRTTPFDFSAGKGYLVANDATLTHIFSGTLNNSDVNISGMTHTSGQGNGWHLLGNPFPAPILWNDGNWVLTNVGGTAKVWDYANNPGNYTDLAAKNMIPSTNGFFVQVASGKTGSVIIPRASRTYNTGHNFKKAFQTMQSETLKMKVSNNQNVYTDICTLGFKNNATEHMDWAFDAHKLFGNAEAPQLWTTSNNEMFSTDYLPYSKHLIDVPLALKAGVNGTYYLVISGQNSFNPNCEIYLEDLLINTTVDLKSQSVYDFTADVNDNPNRFVLHFYNVTAIPEIEKIDKQAIIYCYNNHIFIQSNGKTLNGKVEIINLWGQVVYAKKISQNKLVTINRNLNKGIYIVRYRHRDGTVQSEKIALK